jgi:predicted PurR-regulated permease PerM
MAGESAGTIYAEIRLALDNLQADIKTATEIFRKIEDKIKPPISNVNKQFDKMGKSVEKSLANMANNTVNKFAKMATGIHKSFMALPIVGLLTMITAGITKLIQGINGFLEKTTAAYVDQQKELLTLQAVLKTTGAASWTTSRQLETSASELSKATGRTTNEITATLDVSHYRFLSGTTWVTGTCLH